jgi:putative acetyltransferase
MSKKASPFFPSPSASETEPPNLWETEAELAPEDEEMYHFLLRERGEEYARLFRAGRDAVERYVCWWQRHFKTENDMIKDLGLEPEYFSSLEEARSFLAEIEGTSSTSIVVRPYREEDVQEVVTLFTETVRRINQAHYSPEQIAAWAPLNPDMASWSARCARTTTIVAELAGTIVAFGNLEAHNHIDCLYAHHEHQREGAGTAVLAALENKARTSGKTILFADVSISARLFFTRRGFVEVKPQEVSCRGEKFVNFLMEKVLY